MARGLFVQKFFLYIFLLLMLSFPKKLLFQAYNVKFSGHERQDIFFSFPFLSFAYICVEEGNSISFLFLMSSFTPSLILEPHIDYHVILKDRHATKIII